MMLGRGFPLALTVSLIRARLATDRMLKRVPAAGGWHACASRRQDGKLSRRTRRLALRRIVFLDRESA
jgi:hypothetical protein